MATSASPAFPSASSCGTSRLALAGLFVLLFSCAYAQTTDLSCLKEPYQWGAAPALDASIPELSAIEGADILSDSLRIAFRRAKPQFLTVFFERHQVIRYGDAEAVRRYASFVLPESLDPVFDQQDLPFARKDSLPRPIYFNAEVVFCRARKLGADADAGAIPVEGRVMRQRVKFGRRFHEVWSYALELSGVLPGDTVEVHWKYSIPFMENWMKFNAQRLFFHGDLYKHASHLMIEADGTQGFRHWGMVPDSTAEEGRTVKKFWDLRRLAAVGDEVGARWHAELPFLIIGTMQDAQFYAHRTRSGMWVDIPYWVKAMRLRETRAHWWRQVALKNVPDAQTERMKEFMAMYPGEDPVGRLKKMHNAIANTFEYQLDDAWYDDKDMENQRLGDQLAEKRLREISRYDLYSKLIAMMELKYYTAYLMDRRVGALTLDWLSPVWNNEWTFLLDQGGVPLHLHAKRSRWGLLSNEIPFYWEGTKALVGDVDKLWADGELGAKTPTVPELVPIPTMLSEVNQRRIDMDVNVDLTKGELHVKANVLLTGQWSTTTRSAYLLGTFDSSLMAAYAQRIHDVDGARDVVVELGEVQQEAPFRMPIKVAFTLPSRVVSNGENAWTMDLRELIHHVVDTTFSARGRDLSYWFDFAGRDGIQAKFHFDRPVALVNDTIVQAAIPAAEYAFRTELNDPTTVSFSSVFAIQGLLAEPAYAAELEALFEMAARPPAVVRLKAAPLEAEDKLQGPAPTDER